MTPHNRQLAIGGVLGAAGLAIVYGIYRHRKEILRPVLSSPKGEHEHKHKHDHERGEYGRKKKHGHHHKEHERGEHEH